MLLVKYINMNKSQNIVQGKEMRAHGIMTRGKRQRTEGFLECRCVPRYKMEAGLR